MEDDDLRPGTCGHYQISNENEEARLDNAPNQHLH